MKKISLISLAIIMAAATMAGCGDSKSAEEEAVEKLQEAADEAEDLINEVADELGVDVGGNTDQSDDADAGAEDGAVEIPVLKLEELQGTQLELTEVAEDSWCDTELTEEYMMTYVTVYDVSPGLGYDEGGVVLYKNDSDLNLSVALSKDSQYAAPAYIVGPHSYALAEKRTQFDADGSFGLAIHETSDQNNYIFGKPENLDVTVTYANGKVSAEFVNNSDEAVQYTARLHLVYDGSVTRAESQKVNVQAGGTSNTTWEAETQPDGVIIVYCEES